MYLKRIVSQEKYFTVLDAIQYNNFPSASSYKKCEPSPEPEVLQSLSRLPLHPHPLFPNGFHYSRPLALAFLSTDALSEVDKEAVNIIDTKKLRVIWILQDTHCELQIPLI